jgi:beta-N-acetylhexosaminidase
LSDADREVPAAVVFGCAGPELSAEERDLFRNADPLGFILFARNIESPDQVRRLTADLRASVGRADAIIMIDQEGGRVQRLRPPHWDDYPAMQKIGVKAVVDPDGASECVKLTYRLIAEDLHLLGIDVDCAPVLDLPATDGHEIIGDRAFSDDPEIIARLGQACCDGLTAGGVMPVIKHIPGHGRATADSHLELPHVATEKAILEKTDFAPFRALRHAPAGMTAHIVYDDLDPRNPGSSSSIIVSGIIRDHIGFDGLLFSDDICMKALQGPCAARVLSVLDAGCDVALHCDGNFEDMVAISETCPRMRPDSMVRLDAARSPPADSQPIDRDAAKRRISAFVGR